MQVVFCIMYMQRIIFISREKDLFVTSVVKERYYFKNLSRLLTTSLKHAAAKTL